MFKIRSFAFKKVDICVLGGGPAGIAASLRACDYGKKACIVESERIGGADLWRGALQSKTLWEMAKFASVTKGKTAKRFLKQIKELPPIQFQNVAAAIDDAAKMRESQFIQQFEAAKVDVVFGVGRFETPNTVHVRLSNGEMEIIEADYFIIATGAQPRAHPTAKADGKVVFTSDDIMFQPFPKSIVIIGAGVIGCEFASIFANFDMTKVNVIEKSSRILPMEDEDVALLVQDLLEERGTHFHHHSELRGCKVENNCFYYTLRDLKGKGEKEHVVDAALVSIGRVPNMAKLNLEKIGVKLENGRLQRDQFLRVAPFKHIYACGDVATHVALVNVAEIEARECVEHIYTPYPEEQITVSFDNLSTIMFLDQEVAGVGLNEQQCRKMNIAYKMARYSNEFVGRALAMANTTGFVKLIVTNDEKMQVLGVRAIGPHASSIIELSSLAIHNKESAYSLYGLRTAYPAVTQGFQECLDMLLGCSSLKPNLFPQLSVKEWWPPNFEKGRAYQDK